MSALREFWIRVVGPTPGGLKAPFPKPNVQDTAAGPAAPQGKPEAPGLGTGPTLQAGPSTAEPLTAGDMVKRDKRAGMLKDAENMGLRAGKHGESRDSDFTKWLPMTGDPAEDSWSLQVLADLIVAYQKGYDKGAGDRPRYLGFNDGLVAKKAHASAVQGAGPTQAYEAGYKEGLTKRTELRARAYQLGLQWVRSKEFPLNNPESKIDGWPELQDAADSYRTLLEDLKDFYEAGKYEGFSGEHQDGEGFRAKHPRGDREENEKEFIKNGKKILKFLFKCRNEELCKPKDAKK